MERKQFLILNGISVLNSHALNADALKLKKN